MVKLLAGLAAVGSLIFLRFFELPVDPLFFKLVILIAGPVLGFCLASAQGKRIVEPASIRLAILMLLLVTLGIELTYSSAVGLTSKRSLWMAITGLVLIGIDQRIADTKWNWWKLIEGKPSPPNPLERDFPELYSFIVCSAADWDFDYPDVSAALSCGFEKSGWNHELIREQLQRLLDNIKPYFVQIENVLNICFDDEIEIKEILTRAILDNPLPSVGVESN